MKGALLLLLIGCAVSALASEEVNEQSNPSATVSPGLKFSPTPGPSPKPTTKSTPKPTTTTPKPTTITTTAKTITTKTTTTPKPTTTTTTAKTITTKTTPKPKTTTPKPTTTTTTAKTTTTKSTPKPTTTTPKPTTTTSTTKSTPPPPPKPTPSANVTAGDYSLKTKEGATCMMAHMGVQIRVATKVKGIFTVQPNLTKVEGTCETTKVNFTLSFKEGAITFMFNKSVAENTVYVNALSFSLSYPFASKGDSPYVANNKSVHLFPAKIGHSYSCKNETLYMGNGLYLEVSNDRMQAFNFTNNKDFGSPDLCPADRPDYRVAVAVGVTLLVLIVIVVVAYLLGRRRRTDGYQTL